MDKLTAIKIKYNDGTYSDEIPVSVLAENVRWSNNNNLNLTEVLGNVKTTIAGTVQDQIDVLANEKADASDVTSLGTRVTNVEIEISGIANGSPTPVATVAEMTDESAVYLYTGSETGYTAGNWYYYDGTAWTSGGQYGGAITDSTLSIEGAPADAKAVGDAVDALDDRVTALESDTSGGLTADIKAALLACFANVAWAGDDGQDFYDALDAALNPPANLSSITCVYTQSGTVYDTASLDDLKPDLVVTAHWSDNTTSTITTYTLSGTLTEGTSTITVSYGGKTATFTVTVSVYNTSPSIGVEGSSLKANGTTRSNAGACYTNAYTYELDINAFKQTQYYDESNNYSTTNGALWNITYNVPNSNSVSFSGYTAVCFYDSNDTFVNGLSMTFNGTEKTALGPRYITGYFTLSDNIVKLKFTLPIADIEDSYAYWASPLSGVMPIGVMVGDIIFAGRNTPYWGCSNISEASS